MSKFESRQRNTTAGDDDDLDYFLMHNHTSAQIQQILRTRNLSDNEVDDTLEKIGESRTRINKAVKKFLHLVTSNYPDITQDRLISKGMKFADKYGLSDVEKRVFRVQIIRGYSDDYLESEELRTSDMSKFLGNDGAREYMLRLQPKEHAKLNELNSLYEDTRQLYRDMRNQSLFYRDCDEMFLTVPFDNTKHNKNVSIHPLVFALFVPNVYYLNKRMLYTNIARMILSRGQAYLKSPISYMSGGSQMAEITADFELAHDISFDPNSLAYAPSESPLENLVKRFRIQIELWRNVMNLRNGKLYSSDYDKNDGINGFIRMLNTFEWSFFDSPEFYNMVDDGSLLRKLLAVFACRPTFTRLVDMTGMSNTMGIAKQTYLNIPIVNVQMNNFFMQAPHNIMNLTNCLRVPSSDTFIVHKKLVRKEKQIVFSRDVMFFYVNRKTQQFNIESYDIKMKLLNMPPPFYTNLQELNETQIQLETTLNIPSMTGARGGSPFNLRSTVFVIKPHYRQMPTVEDFMPPLHTGAVVLKYRGFNRPNQLVPVPPAPAQPILGEFYRYDPLMIRQVAPIVEHLQNGRQQVHNVILSPDVNPVNNYRADNMSIMREIMTRSTVYFYSNSPIYQ